LLARGLQAAAEGRAGADEAQGKGADVALFTSEYSFKVDRKGRVSVVGCVLVPVVWIVGAVLCVVAAVSAADGQRYRYPWILRLIT
jgi:uncharacterized Tic20 family protein